MLRWLSLFQPLLLIVAGLFTIAISVKGIWAAGEGHPSRFTVDELVSDHAGQQWLKIKGHVPADMVFTRLSKTNANAPRPSYKIWVPVVSEDWQPTDPVHALVCRVCFNPREASSWKKRFKNATHPFFFTGMLRPLGGVRDYETMFPKLKFAEPMFFLNEGNEPISPIASYLFAGLGILLTVIGSVQVYRLVIP